MTFLRTYPGAVWRTFPFNTTRTSETTVPAWQPAVDIREEQDRYVVRADIPGVDPQEITLSTEEDVLTLKGRREDTAPQDRAVYSRQELPRGEFSRTFRLPNDADPAQISARGKNGVLEIFIPKTEQSKPRTIKVNG